MSFGAHGQGRGAFEAEVRHGVGIGELVGDLTGLQENVEGDDDGARLESPVVHDGKPRDVGAAEGNLVAGLDASFDQ